MVDRGTEADYAAPAEVLETLKIPYFPMVANPDNRQLFRQHLASPGDSMAAFVQYCLPTEDAVIVNLDTQKTGCDAGEFCEERLRWLDHTLSGTDGLPAIVCRGIPFATMRSVLYQAPAPRPAWDWHTFAPSAEAPNLA